MWVKICGITRLDDARVACEARADALGFVFEPRSPRHLPATPDWHRWIAKIEGVLRVAVFVHWSNLPDTLDCFGALQWTPFDETALERFLVAPPPVPLPLWVALRLANETPLESVLQTIRRLVGVAERIVLDSYHPEQFGGTGETHDWVRARYLCAHSPLPVILAGGLKPDNVSEAIQQVHPFGVDVSSGVELSPGCKDAEKVRRFVALAKQGEWH